MNTKTITIGAIVVIMGILIIAVNIPGTPTEFTTDINMTGHYVLYFPLESWIHHDFGAGATDVEILTIHAGDNPQDRHQAQLEVSLDVGPGGGKFVNVSISDGTNTMTISLTGAEIHGHTTVNAFDLDVSAENLTLKYSQTVGGASTSGCIRFIWWYKENE